MRKRLLYDLIQPCEMPRLAGPHADLVISERWRPEGENGDLCRFVPALRDNKQLGVSIEVLC